MPEVRFCSYGDDASYESENANRQQSRLRPYDRNRHCSNQELHRQSIVFVGMTYSAKLRERNDKFNNDMCEVNFTEYQNNNIMLKEYLHDYVKIHIYKHYALILFILS